MFKQASDFNGDVSKWDTAQVTLMHNMFSQATVFNGDVSEWDTAEVEYMDFMFLKASKFNQDLSKWDTAKVLAIGCTDFALDSSSPIDDDPTSKHTGKQTCKAKLENCEIDTESS